MGYEGTDEIGIRKGEGGVRNSFTLTNSAFPIPNSAFVYMRLYSASFSLAWAAASLAMGTLGGEQET